MSKTAGSAADRSKKATRAGQSTQLVVGASEYGHDDPEQSGITV